MSYLKRIKLPILQLLNFYYVDDRIQFELDKEALVILYCPSWIIWVRNMLIRCTML